MSIKTIKIGKQEWATENLNITDKGLGKDHWKNPKNSEVYYSVDAAVRIVSEQAKGFHIPSFKEWDELAKACGCVLIPTEVTSFIIEGLTEYDKIDKLKELLKIKFNGFYEPNDKSFNYVGDCSYFWMTSSRNEKYCYYLKAIDEDTISGKYGPKTFGLSIRLVKDV
jgi:uncharacterized protein (TIGR02145 family)